MSKNERWQFNRHYAGYRLVAEGGRLKHDPLSCADTVTIEVKYFPSHLQSLYNVETGFIRYREHVRSIDREFVHDGTFECYFTAMNSLDDMMNLVESVSMNFLLHPEAETNRFNFINM